MTLYKNGEESSKLKGGDRYVKQNSFFLGDMKESERPSCSEGESEPVSRHGVRIFRRESHCCVWTSSSRRRDRCPGAACEVDHPAEAALGDESGESSSARMMWTEARCWGFLQIAPKRYRRVKNQLALQSARGRTSFAREGSHSRNLAVSADPR
jgi:hypothetical protein